MSTLSKSRYAQRTPGIKSSAIREPLKVTENPEIISFGGGLPAPDVFPVGRFARRLVTKFSVNRAPKPCNMVRRKATSRCGR